MLGKRGLKKNRRGSGKEGVDSACGRVCIRSRRVYAVCVQQLHQQRLGMFALLGETLLIGLKFVQVASAVAQRHVCDDPLACCTLMPLTLLETPCSMRQARDQQISRQHEGTHPDLAATKHRQCSRSQQPRDQT